VVPCSLQVRDAAGFWLGGLAQAGARGCVVTQPGVIAYASDWQTHTKKDQKEPKDITPGLSWCHAAGSWSSLMASSLWGHWSQGPCVR